MFTTEPVEIGDNDRATVDFAVRSIGASGLDAVATCRGELTHDGKVWTAAPELSVRASAPGVVRQVGAVAGAKLRFVVGLEVGGSQREIDAGAFDLRVALDRT
jgi:hypothetical protein